MSSTHDVLVIQHTEVEGPGLLGEIIEERGLRVRLVGPADLLPADALDHVAGIVVLGGPMGVNEAAEYPRLLDEMALLKAAVARDVPVLGICLGSQLLAAALGARVHRAPAKEIGWFELTREESGEDDRVFSALPRTFTALHWHGDVFELPSGARLLARSAMSAYQAFVLGRAWGFLFHLEADVAQTEAMAHAFEEELLAEGISPSALITEAKRCAEQVMTVGRAIFSSWVELVLLGQPTVDPQGA